MDICVLAYKYAIEVSPIVKNLCTFFADMNMGVVDVYIDNLHRDNNFSFNKKNINIKFIKSEISFLRKLISNKADYYNIKKKTFVKNIKEILVNYKMIFAVDFWSLDILKLASADLSIVTVLLLEGPNYIKTYDRHYIKSLLDQCALIIFSDQKRKKDFENYIYHKLDNVKYLPVSLRPSKKNNTRINDTKTINIVYSGYFAEWACVQEIIKLFKSNNNYDYLLTLHGHHMGTDDYLKSALNECVNFHSIKFNTNYYSDNEYLFFLSNYDLGLAFYKDVNIDGNFSNILLSSGKIASYLWAGLGIITNIKDEITKKPPFILVKNFSVNELNAGIENYLQRRHEFRESAYSLADNYYNFDKYINEIINDIIK